MLIAQIALSGPKSMFPNIEGRSTILQQQVILNHLIKEVSVSSF